MISLLFSPDQLNLIGRALAEMKYREVADLFAHINAQIAAEQAAKEPKAPATE